MDFEITNEEIVIKPKEKVLSAEELTKYRNVDIEPLRIGLKRTQPSGSAQETEDLQRLHAELRQLISLPRIERLSGRSLAEWDELEQAVRVTRKDGKFGNFGYNRDGQHYLEFFEALFLLELGRLQLEYRQQLVSVEQSYLLLLGESSTSKYNEYLVYSNFMRVGYILVRHQNIIAKQAEITAHDCIWALLQQEVQNKPIPSEILQSPQYNKILKSMTNTKQSIQEQLEVKEQDSPFDIVDFQSEIQQTAKRKAAEPLVWNTKRSRYQIHSHRQQESYLDFLKTEPEYEKFQEIFQKFDIIQLKQPTESDEKCQRQLQIHFDVHLHNEGFKKSAPKLPNFRLILLPATKQAFPTHAEISSCYNQQLCKVPLLVVSVSESKQIQAFLYFFT